MQALSSAVTWLDDLVWGVPMLVLLLGVGLYLTVGLRLRTIRDLPFAFWMLWRGRVAEGKGEISPFNALMTALSATIGTGNIAGVATAISVGGPGAIFWMWVTAVVGLATKYAEAVLAVKFREVDARGDHVGGPMYYIKNGLGKAGSGSASLSPSSAPSPPSASAIWCSPTPSPPPWRTASAFLWMTGIVLAVLVGRPDRRHQDASPLWPASWCRSWPSSMWAAD